MKGLSIAVRALVVLCFVPSLFAQYATVSANLGDITGNNSLQSFLHFELYNCGYNFPVVSNSSLIPVRTLI